MIFCNNTIFFISFFELNAGSFRFFCFFRFFVAMYVTNCKQQKSLLNLLLPKSYLSEEKRISSTSQRGEVVSWILFVCYFPWVYMRFLFSYSKNARVTNDFTVKETKIQSSFSLSWYVQRSEPERSLDQKYSEFYFCLLENSLIHMLMHKNKNGSSEIISADCILCVYKLLRKAIKIQRTRRYNAHRISL